MLKKFTLFILGVILCSTSVAFMIIYLNLLNMGYSFLDYVKFITRRLECLNMLPGILLIYLSMKKESEKNGLYL